MLTSLNVLCEKLPITLASGYSIGEVTADNVNIRSGAGSQYPIATVKYIDTYAQQMYLPTGTIKIEPAHKGDLMWVKDEGDWYRINPNLIGTAKETPQYIAKKFVNPIMSEPFNLGEITEPQVYISIVKEFDEDGEECLSLSELIFYPKGIAVEYRTGLYADIVKIGNYKDGDPAIRWLRLYDAGYSDAVPSGTHPNISLHETGSSIMLSFNPDNNIKASVKGIETSYPDLSQISLEKWITVFKESQDNKNADVTILHYSDFPFFIKDTLEQDYVRVK